jgi:hypothetical protein
MFLIPYVRYNFEGTFHIANTEAVMWDLRHHIAIFCGHDIDRFNLIQLSETERPARHIARQLPALKKNSRLGLE